MKSPGGYEQEGVIKFQLDYAHQPIEHPALAEKLQLLNAARSVLKSHALIGQDPLRYGGDGFGNISIRLDAFQFLVSGSQTGHLEQLTSADIALVEDVQYAANQLKASGLCKPSSESMTHGVAYLSLPDINAVVHVHSPQIWGHADELGLASTRSDIPYGTPEMADAVRRLLSEEYQKSLISSQLHPQAIVFVMKGHEDGVVAVGATLIQCVEALLDCLSRAQSS